ncbi:hypothetical protein [Rhodococcus sp. USK13]|uniref:hypothetical protein n=1 Tax=Rhodococcus sp. USK13 TaxID=2806442 RepID=UPI001BCC9657|nr:hypothetical protein [Rhodococcus sp. USK13]
MMTNRHGDEIRIGQIWLDDTRRTVIRSLRVDDFTDAGTLGTTAVCTVVQARNTETGDVTRPGRVVSINVDSLHTTARGNGYRPENGSTCTDDTSR